MLCDIMLYHVIICTAHPRASIPTDTGCCATAAMRASSSFGWTRLRRVVFKQHVVKHNKPYCIITTYEVDVHAIEHMIVTTINLK